MKRQRGLMLVFTGFGKGKTTAALGMILRALGHGMKVGLFQFIKGKWHCGELDALKSFAGIDIFRLGDGFTWKKEDPSSDIAYAERGWEIAKKAILDDNYDMVVLDEITHVLHRGFINQKEVIEVLLNRPSHLHVVVTGRYASREIMDAADSVTEMVAVKHHLHDKGIPAQKGIEF